MTLEAVGFFLGNQRRYIIKEKPDHLLLFVAGTTAHAKLKKETRPDCQNAGTVFQCENLMRGSSEASNLHSQGTVAKLIIEPTSVVGVFVLGKNDNIKMVESSKFINLIRSNGNNSIYSRMRILNRDFLSQCQADCACLSGKVHSVKVIKLSVDRKFGETKSEDTICL